MFDIRPYVDEYARLSMLSSHGLNYFALRDVALADLSLHWLWKHYPEENPTLISMLLQGHLGPALTEDANRQLLILRQHAPGLASRLAWRRALEEHERASHSTAYQIAGESVRPRTNAGAALVDLLSAALTRPAPFHMQEVSYAKPGGAHFLPHVAKLLKDEAIELRVPQVSASHSDPETLRSRAVNPPIAIEWATLSQIATEVDKRESNPAFPTWLKPLHLADRLGKVEVSDLGSGFMRNKRLSIEGMQHVVGMLSSGKSTLLNALLFALVSPGYDKKVGVIVRDTASGAALVARLRAHGLNATLLSSFQRRSDHLATLHWASSRLDTDNKLQATGALTEMLGVACPLHGFNQGVENPRLSKAILDFEKRPCHSLKQGKSETKLTCPLIESCPSQSAQQLLSSSQIVVLTPPAFFWMTPDKTRVREHISFPELFQYSLDVILVDEADTVQTDLDELCTQDQVLLSPNVAAFTASSIRSVTESVNLKSGGQYASARHVQWHRTLNRLQDSISVIYHLLIGYADELDWLTYRKPFSTASIFADIYLYAAEKGDAGDEERQATLERVAVLSSSLYRIASAVVDEEPQQTTSELGKLESAFNFLSELRLKILDTSLHDKDHPAFLAIQKELESGCLQWLLPEGVTPRESNGKDDKEKERSRYRRPPAADTIPGIARCVVLAMLSNECLASYAYLVRHHSAVEREFDLASDSAFREAKRIMDLYGHLLPRPLLGAVYGLLFEAAGDTDEGGVLRLVNHLGVGRYLLTHMNRLLSPANQAGPHTLLVSGTSWAGGGSETASPTYDLQVPVAAILSQPTKERVAIAKSRYELLGIMGTPTRVSGLEPRERKIVLQKMARQLVKIGPSQQSILTRKWDELAEDPAFLMERRRRALLVTNNYGDARLIANAVAQEVRGQHVIYCLVPDSQARAEGPNGRDGPFDSSKSSAVIWLPRSQIEEFGASPVGSILVSSLEPASRGHNIVTADQDAVAAISSIFFLHRPVPRPDDLSRFTGLVNRMAHDICTGKRKPPRAMAPGHYSEWAAKTLRATIDRGFALRASYQGMAVDAREQYAWDLMTSLWQTIGRGIRGGVPIYVAFCDERFAPRLFIGKEESAHSSCLKQICDTLATAFKGNESEIARSLYQPFQESLLKMLSGQDELAPEKIAEVVHG